jgi:hypothetical protein
MSFLGGLNGLLRQTVRQSTHNSDVSDCAIRFASAASSDLTPLMNGDLTLDSRTV